MAVGGGVLTTCNYKAREFGVRSGMVGYIAKRSTALSNSIMLGILTYLRALPTAGLPTPEFSQVYCKGRRGSRGFSQIR